MPRLDGTGPGGHGHMTGRQLGRCADASTEEINQNMGRGMGRRRRVDGGVGKGKRLRAGNVD